MGRMNPNGRNKFEPHIRLHRGVTNSQAWDSLSCAARSLLIAIWTRHNGQNNGRIPYSHREAQRALHIGNRKVQAAFQELQNRGFLISRIKGSFHLKKRHATEWELTTEPCDGQPPKALYRTWSPEMQKPVPAMGTDGSHYRNRDRRVIH